MYNDISPKFSRRGEMIEGGKGQLLLAVAAVSAMTLPWISQAEDVCRQNVVTCVMTAHTIGGLGHSGVSGAPGETGKLSFCPSIEFLFSHLGVMWRGREGVASATSR